MAFKTTFWFHHTSNLTEEKFTLTIIYVKNSNTYKKIIQTYLILVYQFLSLK